MSQEYKSFLRPKVRFSQDDAKKSLEEKTAVSASKPKIISVVSLDKPIKVVFPDSDGGIRNLHLADDTTNGSQSWVSTNLWRTGQSSTNPHTTETDNQDPLIDLGDAVKRGGGIQETSKLTNINVQENKINVPPLILSKMQGTRPQKLPVLVSTKSPAVVRKATIPQSKNGNVASNVKCKGQKGKENRGPVKGKAQLSEQSQCVNTKSLVKAKAYNIETTKPLNFSTDCGKTQKASVVIIPVCKSLSSKSATTVMPCHKYKKVLKAKLSPVKKTVVRDIIGKGIKPFVGPGVVHKKQDDYKIPETVKPKHVRSAVSSEKLAKPEYNSIMCTINKLNKVKREKVVPDIEHLPSAYKDLINRKISTTLDFPFEETVFRNLIDLSIDEKQFAGRIIRTKDPEPRQRDVVPKLSDFFVPELLEEYCTPVSVKPRVPEIQDNWNAFRLHEKLLQWKESMDNEE